MVPLNTINIAEENNILKSDTESTVFEGININILVQKFNRERRYTDDAFRVTDKEAIKMSSRYLEREDGNKIMISLDIYTS